MSEELKKVSAGFRLVYIGLVLVVLAVVINVVAGFAGMPRGPGSAIQTLVNGLNFIGTIVGLIGRIKCLSVPVAAGSAKGMITVSVALSVLSILIALVFLLDGFEPFLPLEALVVGGLGVLVMELVATILFLLFTKETANYVRKPDLAVTAMSVLWLWVTTLILFVAAFAILFGGLMAGVRGAGGVRGGGGMDLACVGAILSLIGLVIGLVTLVKYSNLLIAMSAATRAYARGGFAYEDDFDVDDRDDRDDRGRGNTWDD